MGLHSVTHLTSGPRFCGMEFEHTTRFLGLGRHFMDSMGCGALAGTLGLHREF